MHDLVEMMTYKRPEGSNTQKEFCSRYLEPLMGSPDVFGNYVLQIGDKQEICFVAHHDTVHKTSGRQRLRVKDGFVTLRDKTKGECLGADCTTGIWLICNMIANKIPGVYVVHAGEELGCVGRGNLVNQHPKWIDHVNYVIAFDMYGTKSIITHQMGRRTASDKFANKLKEVLDMEGLSSDSNGSFTDSNEYKREVSECTNISIGYYSQHSTEEKQDLEYANDLLNSLLCADWSKLQYYRDNSIVELDGLYGGWYGEDDYGWGYRNGSYHNYSGNNTALFDFVCDYPEEVTEFLEDMGYNADTLREQMDLYDQGYVNNYIERKVG